MSLWQKIKSGWMAFALWIGRINTTILLTLVYILAIGPTALFALLTRRDLLGLRGAGEASYAVPLERITVTIEGAHKQF